MPLEAAKTISQLDQRWPLGTDPASRGDDHLRLLKSVLKNQFPGRTGQGWDKPLTIDVDVLNNIFSNMFPIGTVVFRMDDVDPSTIYGGTWELMTGDATITFGDGNAQTGNAVGENTPAVPIARHKHGVSDAAHAHTKGTLRLKGMIAPISQSMTQSTIVANGPFARTGQTYYARGTPDDADGQNVHGIDFDTNRGGWSGQTSTQLNNLSTDNYGVTGDSAKLNVRGARVAINVWERTA